MPLCFASRMHEVLANAAHLVMKKVKGPRSRMHDKPGRTFYLVMKNIKSGSRMHGKLAHAAYFK